MLDMFKNLFKLFTSHPNSVGEGYFAHLAEAMHCGIVMVLAGIACIIHAILPFLFTSIASDKMVYIIKRLETRYKEDTLKYVVAGK